MTADIRTAAQREAAGVRYWRHRWSPKHVTTVDMTGSLNARHEPLSSPEAVEIHRRLEINTERARERAGKESDR